MVEFVLKNNYFEFSSDMKHRLSGTADGIKLAAPYACISPDQDKKVLSPFYHKDIFDRKSM